MGIRTFILQVCRELKETVCGTVSSTELSLVSLSSLSEGQLYLPPSPRRGPSSGHCRWVQLTAFCPVCHHPCFWLGHTCGAKAFPEVEVIKQKKTKLCFQRASLVGREQSHLSVASLPPPPGWESPGNPAGQGWPTWSSHQPQSYKIPGQRAKEWAAASLSLSVLCTQHSRVPASGRMEHDSYKIHTSSHEAYSSCYITWQVPLAAGSTAAVVHVASCSPPCHGSCD